MQSIRKTYYNDAVLDVRGSNLLLHGETKQPFAYGPGRMPTRTSHCRPQSLTSGRSKPSSHVASSSKIHSGLASRHTRRTIRQHHTLQKQHAAALAASDHALAESIASKIEDAGGLTAYQQASRIGQSRERGGDASSVLVKWLRGLGYGATGQAGLSMLDVGALTCNTAASRSGAFDKLVRIDLESRVKGIQKQDFMRRPLPESEKDKFNVVSLSLVLNYVPEAKERGDMLKRTRNFLQSRLDGIEADYLDSSFLFIVLPAPCLLNSRYLTEDRFDAILVSLGYDIIHKKISAKLVYMLCSLTRSEAPNTQIFKKQEINSGRTRNNFAIIVE